MLKPTFKLFSALLIVLIVSIFSFAQETTAITPEKKALIAEIITAIHADKSVEDTMRAMMTQMEDSYPIMVREMSDKRTDLTPVQKRQITERLIKDHDGAVKFQDRLLESMNFHEYVEQTIYPLYDKFFTEAELHDLLDFYKSPTGQKTMQVMPQLAADSIRLAQQYLLPKLAEISNKIVSEDIAKAQKSLQKP